MSKVIICNTKTAYLPYIFTNTKVEIYSYEELCYYIFNNVVLLNKEQCGRKLVYWLRKELELDALATQLEQLQEQNAELLEVLVAILTAFPYYDTEEIRCFIDRVNHIKVLPEAQIKKLRGDSFLRYKRYMKAITIYDELLTQQDNVTPEFLGKIYHNKGVAMAKNLEIKKAKECFSLAYEFGKAMDSLQAYGYLALMTKDKEQVWQVLQGYGMSQEMFEDLYYSYQDAFNDAEGTLSYVRYTKALYNYQQGDIDTYRQRLEPLIQQWKEEIKEQVI